ncbi:conjugal transfer protein TraG N-terminal domain-containing protein [Marinospirillum insulare]|uniref:conjugal transfer protein TraG N-terminal domain-containing protein n=1 Tax=Marinospirillum insulare TaxID=217169 RepID=UPI0024E0C6C0|nr:conjugal transfer protein TraG N-terminal domain-containing protein [Marinospirillum insulare]
MLSAGTVNASPMGGDYWEFNAYANADAVADILNALSGIVKSGGFKSIYLALAMLGLAISAGTGLIGGNPKKLIGYFMGFMLLTYAVFGLKVNVLVKEMVYVSGTPTHNTVAEVPGAIAIPMASISYLGTGLTNLLETYMTKPITNNPSLPEGVLPFGAKSAITKDMTELRITDPNIARNFKEWVSKCAVPRLVSRQMSINEMANSTDLLQYFKDSPANTGVAFVQFYTSKPMSEFGSDSPYREFDGIFSCGEGIAQLETELKAHIGDSLSSIGKRVFPQYSRDALLSSDIASSIAGDLLGKSASTATSMAMQGAIIDVVNGVGQYQAEVLGADSTLLAMNINNAQRSQKTGWYTASVLFRDMSSYMYAAIQVFLMGIAPLIIILMLVPGMGAKLGGSYMKAVVWLASWWPALHIVNFMMESYYANSANSVYGTADPAVFGLSLMNAGASNAFSDNMIIAIGFMATLVPTLMWGIINGTGMALTSMLDRASGAQYASGAAQDAAAGNFRAGNISTNTYSANKYDDMQTRVTGRAPVSENYAGSGINQSTDLGGQGVSLHGKAADKSISESQARRLSDAREQVDTSKEALSNAVTSTATESAKELSSYGQNASIDKSNNLVFKEDEAMNGTIQNVASLLHSAKYTDENSQETFKKIAAQSGVDVGFGSNGPSATFRVGGTAEAGYRDATKVTASYGEDGSLVFKNDQGENFSLGTSNSSGSSIKHADVAASQSAYENSDAFATIESRVKSFEQAESYAKKVSDDVSRERNITVGQGVDQQDISNVNNGEDPNMPIRNVDKDRGGDVPVSKVSNNAQVAGGTLISGAQNQVDASFGGAQEKYHGEKDNRVAERLDSLNSSNLEKVNMDTVSRMIRDNGEAPSYYNDLQSFSIGGNNFDPVGHIANNNGAYDMVYRSSDNEGNHNYYAVSGDSLTRLNNLSYGDKGEVRFSGQQINQFDNHRFEQSGVQQVEATREGVQQFHNSLESPFGNGVALDASSHVNLNEYSGLRNVDDEYSRVGNIPLIPFDKGLKF